MRLFIDLPTPKTDEAFSSWVYRCIHSSKSKRFGRHLLESGIRVVGDTPEIVFEDPDFNPGSDYFLQTCDKLNIDIKCAASFFTINADPVVPWEQRSSFCARCLKDDVASGTLPVWRKSWCYENSIMCHIHRVELISLDKYPTLAKAWDAFCQITQYPLEKNRWDEDKFARLRLICISRVSRWLKIQRHQEPAASQVNVYAGLYAIFLKVPTIKYPPGLARRLFYRGIVRNFRVEYSFLDCINKGAANSLPRNRFGSIVLLGWLLEILTPLQLAGLLRRFSDVSAYFPSSLQEVSRNVLGIAGLTDYLEFKKYLGVFFRPSGSKIDLFLADQERACKVYFAYDLDLALGAPP